MIRAMVHTEIPVCVEIIKNAFSTVAEEFHITAVNAPRFTAFATSDERLKWQFHHEKRPMYVYVDSGNIIGYFSLLIFPDKSCELNNLSVLPEYRHRGIGAQLLEHAFSEAKKMGCSVMKIGIVEENKVLRRWYETFGFVHTGVQKFDFFPFHCGYLYKEFM